MVLVSLVVTTGCVSSSSSDPADAIVNGPTMAGAATYWKSQQGCLVSYGGGFCSTEFEFSIAADGTAQWAGGTGCGAGVGTWTKIGPAVISLGDVCKGGEGNAAGGVSLTMTGIDGAIADGFFTADVSGYFANRFTIQTGSFPGF